MAVQRLELGVGQDPVGPSGLYERKEGEKGRPIGGPFQLHRCGPFAIVRGHGP
jgi:hypothetical protein